MPATLCGLGTALTPFKYYGGGYCSGLRIFNPSLQRAKNVNFLVLYNCVSLALLGEGLYCSMITTFKRGHANSLALSRKYVLVLAPNFISRSVASYALAALTASLYRSGVMVVGLHFLIASRLAMTACGVQTISASFSSNANSEFMGHDLPRAVSVGVVMAAIAESVVCALFCSAIFRATMKGPYNKASPLAQMARHAIPAYVINMLWQLAFAVGVWFKSAAVTACFGVPVGAVSIATLLALLHVHPSVLAFPPQRPHELNKARFHQSSAPARISIAQETATVSCHDSPLEVELMERLERQFPSEEESKSYSSELNVPETRRGKTQAKDPALSPNMSASSSS
ncbi:hypothetical protein DL93DRAFT_2228837 [Clavulina sp. PMI_390]|nr:hypothetical protein DL93DRAFT_2228837 [Clavulina sp. PMI_390]